MAWDFDFIAIKDRLAAYRKASDAACKAWRTRLEKVMADRNNGVPPVRGKNKAGFETTYHAPCDGYLHEWMEGDRKCRDHFMGGQFLPMDKYKEPWIQDGSLVGFHAAEDNKLTDVPIEALGMSEEFLLNGYAKEPDYYPFCLSFNNAVGEEILRQGKPYRAQYGPFAGKFMCYVYFNGRVPRDVVDAVADYLLADKRAVEAKIEAEREAKKAEQEARAAAAPDVPEERLEIVGEVLTIKWQDSDWGGALKMLVIDDRGFKVWGSVPRAIEDDLHKGMWVAFVATCEPSKDDPKFGFFKRPSKAKCWEPDEVAA